MMSRSTSSIAALRRTISEPRFATYLTAAQGDPACAMELYGWNAQLSAAFVLPAHFAEVAIRNAVAAAIENVYRTPNWPWNRTFELSLPDPGGGYSPRKDLKTTRSQQPTTGKVVAELKFAFWPRMFTARHDQRIWLNEIRSVLPHAPAGPAPAVRSAINADLDHVRRLRNRLAHHEPIIARNHADDLARIMGLIAMREPDTANWVSSMETVTSLINTRP